MKDKVTSSDPDIRASWPALLRAARRAQRLALATGTPLYVLKNGKVVNLNPKGRLRRRPR
ncbi:MAG TPA: hypothetical protein PLP01_14285 [Phycisphaerae bacterium]|nr:hypothetical protein [Phycisphaerae bacterium]